MRAAKAATPLVVTLGILAAVTSCGGGSGSSSKSPTPSPAALELQQRAAASRDSQFTATYGATAGTQTATISVWFRNASTYRVDIVQNGITASFFGTPTGTVACSIAAGLAPACFLVAETGKPIPAAYDAGVERVFTRDLPALATSVQAFSVAPKESIDVQGALPAARCYAIAAQRGSNLFTSGLLDDVDLGTYCLSDSGPPRRLDFTSGSLTLQTAGPAPSDADLTPPAAATPLPSPSTSPSASPSPPFGLLGSAAPQA